MEPEAAPSAAAAEEGPKGEAKPQWPKPIPQDWAKGRAANAEAWFQEARDAAER